MWIALILIAVFAVTAIGIFNTFIKRRAFVWEAWSGIDVQLKRRHDLIPNILEVVKGYMQFERKLLEDITNIRASLTNAVTVKEKSERENNLSGAFKSIFAVVENYPDIKANQDVLGLQKNLTETEDQIQLARRYYNGTVRNYNILVESFPSNILATIFNFKPADFFEIEYATERNTPDVKFGT